MKPIRLIEEAEAEFGWEINWYEAQESGLGDRFRDTIHAAFASIQKSPSRWRLIPRSVARRYRVDTFPFVIVYAERPAYILVYSIFHTSRDPKVWRDRLGGPPQP